MKIGIGFAYTDDFSAGLWVKIPTGTTGDLVELIGQGKVFHSPFNGWGLFYNTSDGKLSLQIAATTIDTNSAISEDAWYLFGFTRVAAPRPCISRGCHKRQRRATSPTGAQTDTWIGNCSFTAYAGHGCNSYLSWAFLINTPLSGADWLEIWETADTGGALAGGLVWTSNGAGGASWELPRSRLTTDADRPASHGSPSERI